MESNENSRQGLSVLGRLIRILDGLGIAYAIGGSMASSVFGSPRFTQDADVVVSPFPNKLAAFLERVEPEFYVSEESVRQALGSRSSFNLIHLESALKVDFFIRDGSPYFKGVLDRRVPIETEADGLQQLQFVSPEDIVLLKLRWFRQGGEVSDSQWSDVQAVLAVQGERLDRAYLGKWAAVLGLADLLERALSEAKGA